MACELARPPGSQDQGAGVPCPRRDRRTHTLQAGSGDEEGARSRRTDAGVDVRARRSARVLTGREQRRVLQTTGSIPCAEHRRRRALTFLASNAATRTTLSQREPKRTAERRVG